MNDRPLAIDGGTPTFPEGPPSWPRDDIGVRQSLNDAMLDGCWGRYMGPFSQQLVARLSEAHRGAAIRLCSSGTIAVELALRGVGVRAGDEVVLAGYDFPGNFRAIEAIGATPVLADIDPRTWCLAATSLNESLGPKTRAILVSHLHGGLADMRPVCELAERNNVAVVEDACQAAGAHVAERPAGTWGDAGVLSFGGSKLLTAGRGGAVLTFDPVIEQRIRVFADRGNDAFPLSELQSAALLPQIAQLPDRHQQREAAVRRLLAAMEDVRAILRPVASFDKETNRPAFYKLAWLCEEADRATFLAAAQAEGIAIDAGFRGFVRRTSRRCRQAGDLAASDKAASHTVILHHPILLEPDSTVDRLAAAIVRCAQRASRKLA